MRNSQPVTVSLTTELLSQLDTAIDNVSGVRSRSALVRKLIQRGLDPLLRDERNARLASINPEHVHGEVDHAPHD